MALQLDDQLRERLSQIRQAQLQNLTYWDSVEALLVQEEVVAVRDGFGGASFIGLDGRVIYWNSRQPDPPAELTDPQSVAQIVVYFATLNGIPELLSLLPTMPQHAIVCRACKGKRLQRAMAQSKADGIPQVCSLCSGLGWTTAFT